MCGQQFRPWSDATHRGIWSGFPLFAKEFNSRFYCIGFPMADLVSSLFYSCFVVNHIYHKYYNLEHLT